MTFFLLHVVNYIHIECINRYSAKAFFPREECVVHSCSPSLPLSLRVHTTSLWSYFGNCYKVGGHYLLLLVLFNDMVIGSYKKTVVNTLG